MRWRLFVCVLVCCLPGKAVADASAETSEFCEFTTAEGRTEFASSRSLVPKEYQNAATCKQVTHRKRSSAVSSRAKGAGSRRVSTGNDTTQEICQYRDERGAIVVARGRAAVPERYRSVARCAAIPETMPPGSKRRLAKPEDIELEGSIRRQTFQTSIGEIRARWPRAVERIFGRTPSRAILEAARAVARAVRRPGFPSHVRDMNVSWELVFLDEKLPEQQIPQNLISNCHPGWMTPPGNVYIVAQRAAAGCGGGRVTESIADERLAEVLVHEFGHGVEWQLLRERGVFDRARAEGFATWFEQYVAKYSSLLNYSKMRARHVSLARSAIKREPHLFLFRGDARSYARASMYFYVLEERFGVGRIADIYDVITKEGLDFSSAVRDRTSWNTERFHKEIARVVERTK